MPLAHRLSSRQALNRFWLRRPWEGIRRMPTTRSVSRAANQASAATPEEPQEAVPARPKKAPAKRKAAAAPAAKAQAKRARTGQKSPAKAEEDAGNAAAVAALPAGAPKAYTGPPPEAPELVPAVLTFSFEDAKRHLTEVDGRFEDIFRRMPCKPFEHLEMLDPFRTLVNSIMGQQISWKAARSIINKFVRLFDPSLPEKPGDDRSEFFPTANQVASMDIATLRSAGLSGRKAEYVLDLSERFADGRLSTEKLLEANDEELAEMLIAVRGIGRWTVDMFAIFSLRRPDILPIGDLGVQRGVLRWFYSLHSPNYDLTISPEKLPKTSEEEKKSTPETSRPSGSVEEALRAPTPDASSVMPAPPLPKTPAVNGKVKDVGANSVDATPGFLNPLPPPFTPSINKTLNNAALNGLDAPPPLPEGITPALLKSRMDGKKVKGAFLTPKEMEDLTASWRPYRSLGVYYMWALAS